MFLWVGSPHCARLPPRRRLVSAILLLLILLLLLRCIVLLAHFRCAMPLLCSPLLSPFVAVFVSGTLCCAEHTPYTPRTLSLISVCVAPTR